MNDNHHHPPTPTPTPRKKQHQQHSLSSSSSNSNSRSSEMASNLTRTRSKLHKLTKENLIAESTAVSEDISSPILKESEVSPVSEDSDGVVYSESFKDSQDPEITALPEMFDLEVSPMSKITTGYCDGTSSALANQFRAVESGRLKMNSLEAEVAAEPIEQALFQVMKSGDVDRRAKKIIEAVLYVVLEDSKGLLEEKDMLSRVVAAKSRIVLCSFLLWIIFASVVLFMNTRAVPFSEPPPT